nr:MAG TPA: hypothetical protein [Caudoviricetes sp.]
MPLTVVSPSIQYRVRTLYICVCVYELVYKKHNKYKKI